MTTTPTTTPDVPLPAGAVETHDWKSEDGNTSRMFWGYDTEFEGGPVPMTAHCFPDSGGWTSASVNRLDQRGLGGRRVRRLRAGPRRLRAVPGHRRPKSGPLLAGPSQKLGRNESRCLSGVHGDVALGVPPPLVTRTRVTNRVVRVAQIDRLGTEHGALDRQRSAGAVSHGAKRNDRRDVVRVLRR